MARTLRVPSTACQADVRVAAMCYYIFGSISLRFAQGEIRRMSGPDNYNQPMIETFRRTGGQVPGWDRLLLLTTTGARSGKQRTSPVVYSMDGDRYVIAATKSGAPTNPDWYHNLVAHPLVTVEVGTETFQARASVADESERERLYARHAEGRPNFVEYQRKTTRKIPVVRLERLS